MARSEDERRTRRVDDRTLEELDGEQWGEPTFGFHVVTACHALRRKPIGNLTDEELRLADGQGIGLEWLVPLMMKRLAQDPFRAGDFYEGDLLESLARVPAGFWEEHPAERAYLAGMVVAPALADRRLSDMDKATQKAIAALRALMA